MADIEFLPGARSDYFDARDWYQPRSPRAMIAFETAVEVALRRILDDPQRHPKCDSQHRFYILRKFPFSIVYRIIPAGILVVAVAHSSRDHQYWKSRDQ